MNRDYQAIQRVLVVTLMLNIVATAAKLFVGFTTGALSVIADGLDSLFDSLSNVIGIIATRIGSLPPDDEHPYGHRKFETLAALLIASLLFVTAWELGMGAFERFANPTVAQPDSWGLLLLLLGALVQGVTGWWELRQGKRLESEVIIADARHTLTSLFVSATVLVGLGLVWLGYAWVDPLVTIFVALFIARVGAQTVLENVPVLVDQAPIDSDSIGEVVGDVTGVQSYHRIRSRGTQDSVAVDLHVRVDPRLSMQAANAIADEVRRRLLILEGVDDVTVHVEAQKGPQSAADLQQAVRLAAQAHGVALHEIWVQQSNDLIDLHLHVGVDPNLTLEDAHQAVDALEKTLAERVTNLNSVYTHIEAASVDVLPASPVSLGLQRRIEESVVQAAEATEGVSNPHAIQVRQVEGRLFVAVEAHVPGDLSVSDAHDLSTHMQKQISEQIPSVGEVMIHLEPPGVDENEPSDRLTSQN